MAISALTGVLIRLIARHGLIQGPRVARKMGFATKSIQKAFQHPSLNKFPIPDGRKLRYAKIKPRPTKGERLKAKADAINWYEEFARRTMRGESVKGMF